MIDPTPSFSSRARDSAVTLGGKAPGLAVVRCDRRSRSTSRGCGIVAVGWWLLLMGPVMIAIPRSPLSAELHVPTAQPAEFAAQSAAPAPGRGSTSSQSSAPPGMPASLRSLVGNPFVVEVPTLDDLGSPLPRLPRGWQFFQVDSDSFDEVTAYLKIVESPAIAIFDEFGNCLLVDAASSGRKRISERLREYGRRKTRVERKLKEAWESSLETRRRNRTKKEIEDLDAARSHESELGRRLRGYPDLRRIEARLAELDGQLRVELFRLLAAEGLVSKRTLEGRLERLLQKSKRLPIHREVARRLRLVRDGFLVDRQESR